MRRLSFAFVILAALAVTAVRVEAQARASAPPSATAAAPLDLNTATVTQLEALPGVGPRTAQLIVEHRQKNGGFKKVEELMNIKGIGEKSFLKLKPRVTVGPQKAESDASAQAR